MVEGTVEQRWRSLVQCTRDGSNRIVWKSGGSRMPRGSHMAKRVFGVFRQHSDAPDEVFGCFDWLRRRVGVKKMTDVGTFTRHKQSGARPHLDVLGVVVMVTPMVTPKLCRRSGAAFLVDHFRTHPDRREMTELSASGQDTHHFTETSAVH